MSFFFALNLNNFNNLITIPKFTNEGIKLKGISLFSAKIKKDIDAAVAELAKSEEFIEKTKQESNKEEVTDEQLKSAAEKVIFLDSMKSFEAEVGGFDQALAELRSETGKMLQEILPSKAGIDLLKKSKNPESKKVVDLVEKTKQKFSVK